MNYIDELKISLVPLFSDLDEYLIQELQRFYAFFGTVFTLPSVSMVLLPS